MVVAIPLPYSEDGDFWGRDAGLLIRGFQRLGLRATLVAIRPEGSQAASIRGDELVLASGGEETSEAFWKRLHPDAVVLYAWTRPRFQPLRAAVRKATPLLAEHMDTDGMRGAVLNPAHFFYLSWAQAMDRWGASHGKSWLCPPALFAALWQTGFSLCATPVLGLRAARTVSRIPAVLVESEPALQRIRRWLKIFGLPGGNLHVCPHSVDTHGLGAPKNATLRARRVVAIGRWRSFQKNWQQCLELAKSLIAERPDYEFHIVGETPLTDSPAPQIILHGRLERSKVTEWLGESQILVVPSRYESFHLASGEALCCGCSVVESPRLTTAAYFAEDGCGTVARRPTTGAMLEALRIEIRAWESGQRDPEKIATKWRARLSPESQAAEILRILGIPATTTDAGK